MEHNLKCLSQAWHTVLFAYVLILQKICSMCIYEDALYLKNRKPLDRNAHLSLNIPIIASWRSFLKAPYLMSVEHHLLCWPLYILILSKSNFYEETSVSFNIEYKYSSITHRHLHHLCPPTPSSLSTLLLHLFPLLQLPNSFFFFLSFLFFFEIIMKLPHLFLLCHPSKPSHISLLALFQL